MTELHLLSTEASSTPKKDGLDPVEPGDSHDDIMNERKREDMLRRQQEQTKKAQAARMLKKSVISELATIAETDAEKSKKRKASDDSDSNEPTTSPKHAQPDPQEQEA